MRNLLREPDLDDASYPNAGGYQEYIVAGGSRRGWQEECKLEKKDTTEESQVILSLPGGDRIDIKRVITISRDSGTQVRLRTTVTNNRSEPLDVQLTASTELRLGRIQDCELVIPAAGGKAQRYCFTGDKHDHRIILQDEPVKDSKYPNWMLLLAPKPPEDWLLVMHPLRQVGIRQTYNLAGTRRCQIGWDFGRKHLNLKLVSPKITLEPSGTFSYSNCLDVIHDLAGELADLNVEPLQAQYAPVPKP